MPAPRFGIGEWYGHSFTELQPEDRRELAQYIPNKRARLKKEERLRLSLLEKELANGAELTAREQARLSALRKKLEQERASNKPCPFRRGEGNLPCTKDGGVCSLRLYEEADGIVMPAPGDRGGIRALCPHRFHESNIVLRWIGTVVLGTEMPAVVSEVGFLESAQSLDGDEGEDVGRIDMVLVDSTRLISHSLFWAAVEFQAVYFSGKEMATEFRAITENVELGSSGMIWPSEIRRPDYRSSGPKRLMPQLQIKVPTLRRWGKKMCVVVDRSFFESLGAMDQVPHLSNADIAWFIVDFEADVARGRFRLVAAETRYTTLEEAVIGLTGGRAISLDEFEARIKLKLAPS